MNDNTNNPLIEDDTVDTLDHISQALASLKDHLSRHAEGEQDYPKIAEVFEGMSKNAGTIKAAIDYESTRMTNQSLPKRYPHGKEFQEWIENIPVEFPPVIDFSKGHPTFFNSLIGDDKADTIRQIRYILEMFKTLALPSYTEKADFSLGEDETMGFFHVLDCMTGALAFEEKYRNNGYYEDYDEAEPVHKDHQ